MSERHIRELQKRKGEFSDRLNYDIMCVIATDTGRDNSPAKTSHRGIALRAGCHYNTVGKRLKQLVDGGWIDVVKEGGYEYYPITFECGEPEATDTKQDCHTPYDNDSELSQRVSHLEEKLSQALSQIEQIIVTISSTENMTKESKESKESKDTSAPTVQKPPQDEINKAKAELERYFAIKTQLPVPPRATKKQKAAAAVRWWNPITELWEMCRYDTAETKRLIDAALLKMAGLTFDSPESILKTARATYAEAKRNGMQIQSSGNMNGSLNGLRGV